MTLHPSQKISVFIVDDHPPIVDGIKAKLIRMEDFIFSGSAYAKETLLEEINGRIHVLLLDVLSEDEEFLDLIKTLRSKYPNMCILILSGRENLHFAKETIENGANGFISKVLAMDDICNAMREVYRYPKMKLIKIPNPGIAENNDQEEVKNLLTHREKQVISLLCRGFPNNQEIADILTGINGEHIAAATVQGHRRNIRAKLRDYGVTNDTSLGYWTALWQLLDGTELSSAEADE